MSFGTQRTTDEIMLNDNRLSSSALEKNIKEAEALKTRAERQLEAILKETVMLEEETSRTEAIHEKMKDPLQVAEENLIIRSKRPTREQTRDAVERSLNEQIAGAKHSIRMLGGVLDACDKELAKLKVCREKLEEDIDQKRIALEVDNEALRMESGWAANIQSKRAPSASLPHMWRQRTENLCEECERTRATCERLRAKSKAIQEEALNVERETREAVLRNFARKMEETDRLKSELESSIANVSNEIVTMEDARASVEQSMNDKHGPLALAKSRLSFRTSKPGNEIVRDAAERSLEKEIGDLEHSIRRLQLEMARQTADIHRLEQTRARLESDLKDKMDALALEQECEALQMDLSTRMK
uniref:Tektin n=1 Tax=Hanusia phi TaxID=3032 RepID=A0A7S0I2L7_9CRYP